MHCLLYTSMFMTFLKYTSVKFQSFRIRSTFIPLRINPGPVNRHPVDLESHFGKQSDIFLVMMIEINGFMGWVMNPRFYVAGNSAWRLPIAGSHMIGTAFALAPNLSLIHILIFRCSSVQSLNSTIFSIMPSALRIIRPYCFGSSSTAVNTTMPH